MWGKTRWIQGANIKGKNRQWRPNYVVEKNKETGTVDRRHFDKGLWKDRELEHKGINK